MADDAVETIKERLSIVDVVSPYVKLTKSGKYYKGLSPFTKEKTPSFFVSPDRGLYHCFSSGKGGDMFTFIQEMEGVDFRGALHTLAERAGVELASLPSQGARDYKEKLFAALRDAETYFQKQFELRPDIFSYLKERGVTTETAEAWRVGFAPDAWRDLSEHLQELGHTEQVLLDAGLIKRPDGERSALSTQQSGESEGNRTHSSPLTPHRSGAKRPYDRFRNRIMFPIYDISNRVVGFSGRFFGPSSEGVAKYLNSPETNVFSKSHVLYGLHVAKEGIRKYGFAILVEGQFDVLMAHQAGYTNTVALSGTAFTEHHAKLIRRYTPNLLIAFDGDRAGIAASGRAAQVSLPQGLNVKIAAFPSGEDPADLIKRDVVLWREAVKKALPVVDFYLEQLRREHEDERTFKLEVSRVVLPYIPLIENAIDRAHFTERIATALSVPVRAVEIELEKLVKAGISTQHTASSTKQFGIRGTQEPQQTMSGTYEPFLSRSDTLERLLFGIAESVQGGEYDFLRSEINTRLEVLLGKERFLELTTSSDEKRIAVIEGDLFLETHMAIADKQSLIQELLHDFEKELHRGRYRMAVLRLKEAEKGADQELISECMKAVHELAKNL